MFAFRYIESRTKINGQTNGTNCSVLLVVSNETKLVFTFSFVRFAEYLTKL